MENKTYDDFYQEACEFIQPASHRELAETLEGRRRVYAEQQYREYQQQFIQEMAWAVETPTGVIVRDHGRKDMILTVNQWEAIKTEANRSLINITTFDGITIKRLSDPHAYAGIAIRRLSGAKVAIILKTVKSEEDLHNPNRRNYQIGKSKIVVDKGDGCLVTVIN